MAHPALGVILAGGRGLRFGGPKALATLPDGRTFLAACAATLEAAGVRALLATLPPGLGQAAPAGVTALPLPADGLTMFDSLKVALQHGVADPGWLAAVVHPVDHPLVVAETVRSLLDAVLATGAEVARPSLAGKHGHPVVLGRGLCEAVASGRHPGPTLREVLGGVSSVDVPVEDAGVGANCNAPERLAEAWALVSRGRVSSAPGDAA